jgi:hypothetical protein
MNRKLLLCIATMIGCAQAAVIVESAKFRLEFDDASKALIALTDKANNDRQQVSVAQEFSFVVNAGAGDITVSSSNSTIASAGLSQENYVAVFNNAQGTVTVTYALGTSGHYAKKSVRFAPSFSGQYSLKRVKTFVFTPAGSATRVAHLHGAGGYTNFLRKANNSFFFAVQAIPAIPISTAAANPIELQYDANINLTGVYDAETSLMGCCTRTHHTSPSIPQLHRCPTSSVGLDDGEAEAMVAVMSDMGHRHSEAIRVHFNGWQAGINITESSYADPAFKKTLLTARDSILGRNYYFTASYPWFGHKARMPGLSPSDTCVPYHDASETDFLAWLHANGIRSLLWTVTAHSSINPAEPRYCQSYEPFHLPRADENCIADATFMSWFAKVNINEIKKGHEGWSHDEEGNSNNYTTYTCSAANHSHVAGANVSYGCFYERKKLWKRLRARFGEDFELWDNRQEIDTGPWEWLDLTSALTYSEFNTENDSPVKERFCARARHYYNFCPSWLHQAIVYPNQSGPDPDKLMLSLLAVARNYLFGDGMNVPSKSRIKYWLDWARSHGDYMGESKYLPLWPGEGADGYMRIHGGNGYAFIFNDYGSTASITLPLDSTAGLDGSASYTIGQVFPAQPGTSTARGSTTISLANGAYRLLSITPTVSRAQPAQMNEGLGGPALHVSVGAVRHSAVITIDGIAPGSAVRGEVFDLRGRVAAEYAAKSADTRLLWDIGMLPNGSYIVRVQAGSRKPIDAVVSVQQ